MNRFTLTLLTILSSAIVFAQPPGGQGRQFDPTQMVAMEKQLLLDSISDLNEDQKLIINEIYKDYEAGITKARESRDPNNREAMRENMTKIRQGKDEALQAILTEDQFKAFRAMLDKRRAAARGRRGNRNE